MTGPVPGRLPRRRGRSAGGAWVAYVVHKPRGAEVFEAYTERPKDFADLAPKTGGDQIRLLRFADGKAGDPLDVTGEGLDVWRPAVAVDGDGSGRRRLVREQGRQLGPLPPDLRPGHEVVVGAGSG